MVTENLQAHYNLLWNNAYQSFLRNEYVCDPALDLHNDDRFGLTLLVRPSPEVTTNIQKVIEMLQDEAPDQYFYRPCDLHLTIMPLISCYRGFQFNSATREAYSQTIRKALAAVSPFRIEFKGISASASCVIVQGFPKNDSLNFLRDDLRKTFSASNLEKTMDVRYKLVGAHISFLRFRKKIRDGSVLLNSLTRLRQRDFGAMEVNEIEFVFNDWYQRKENVKVLDRFSLN